MQATFPGSHPCSVLLPIQKSFLFWKLHKASYAEEEGHQHTVSVVTMTCAYMYLSSNVTQWDVANCMVFSIPPSPICSVKCSCSKCELKQTAPKVNTYMCDATLIILKYFLMEETNLNSHCHG